MPSLIDLRRRIRSVKNTQQITKAMKVVSAAKLRRAQDRVLASRPYAQIIRRMLANVALAAADHQDSEEIYSGASGRRRAARTGWSQGARLLPQTTPAHYRRVRDVLPESPTLRR